MENKYEPIRQAALTLGVSMVIAAAFIGWSLPDSQEPQKYQAFVVDNKIVRLHTSEGYLVICDFSRCVRLLGRGKDIEPNSAPGLISGSEAVPEVRKSVPAPAPSKPAKP